MRKMRLCAGFVICGAAVLTHRHANAVVVPFDEPGQVATTIPTESSLQITGTLLASRSDPLVNSNAILGGALEQAVYRNAAGTIDFVYRFNFEAPSEAELRIQGYPQQVAVDIRLADNNPAATWSAIRDNRNTTLPHLDIFGFAVQTSQMSAGSTILIRTDSLQFTGTTALVAFRTAIGRNFNSLSIPTFQPVPDGGLGIPEPASLTLLSLAVLALYFRIPAKSSAAAHRSTPRRLSPP